MGEVVWLGRYPVKSMLGECLSDAVLTESGVAGDRRYALIDQLTGLVASAKNPRKWRKLLTMAAQYDRNGQVSIELADGTVVRADDPTIDDVLSQALGRAVRLTRNRPTGATLERLTPSTEPSAGTMTRGGLAAGTPGDTFVDFAAAHVVTTATLDALAREHPGRTMPHERFRPNIVVRMIDSAPFVENTWTSQTLTIGSEAEIRVIAPTPRCAVPTLAQGKGQGQGQGLPVDPEVLRVAARANRVPVLDLGLLTCVGAYAAVSRSGPLRIGDQVVVAA